MFTAVWNSLSETLGKEASPIFYQYISGILFKEQVQQQYPVCEKTGESQVLPELDYRHTMLSGMQLGM